MVFGSGLRNKLLGEYEKKYQSEKLKELIGDPAFWRYNNPYKPMEGAFGARRLMENDLLFTYLDRYLDDMEYAFLACADGRFVCVPEEPAHQGIGMSVNKDDPSRLEIGQLWYPGEFTTTDIISPLLQIYVPMYLLPIDRPDVTDKIREHFALSPKVDSLERYCTFSFALDHCVLLEGKFLDNLPQTEKTIRKSLVSSEATIFDIASRAIAYMRKIMK